MLIYILLGAVAIGTAGLVYGVSMLFSNDEKLVNSRHCVSTIIVRLDLESMSGTLKGG